MRRLTAAILGMLVVFVAARAVAGEHPWNDKRLYYVIEFMGRLAEKGTFVRRNGSYQKKPCIVVEEERYFFDPANPSVPERAVKTRILTDPMGRALFRAEAPLQGGGGGQENITVLNGEARFVSSGVYGTPGRVPVSPDVLFEIGGEFLARLRPKRGAVYSASVLDRTTRGVVTAEIVMSGQERQGGPDTAALWLADISTPGRPMVTAWYTPDGRLVRLEGGGMSYQIVAREDYEAGRIPPRGVDRDTRPAPRRRSPEEAPDPGAAPYPPDSLAGWDDQDYWLFPPTYGNSIIPIGASVPAWDSFAWVLLAADPAHDWSGALANSEYSRIDFNGVSTTIMSLRNAPPIDASVYFPMQVPPPLQPYLVAGEAIPSDRQAIVEAAYAATLGNESNREETNVLRAVSYLAGWINQNVAVEGWGGYNSSALDTLARRSGDSLGHARLFVAMARTLGVPARVCQGFLAHTYGAVNHCWGEVWIAGRWMPVDTTVNRVGLPAGYVLAERGQGNGVFRFDFTGFMRTPALGLRLLSAGRETPGGGRAELRVGDRRTYAHIEDDWLCNLYWGFSTRLPEGWRGRARLNSAELSDSGGRATARVEAMEGNFEAGKPELDATVESLRQGLGRFRVIDSRIVSFDADGATPAMFIDFTCVEDGRTLRCRQYIVPRRQRAFRVTFWAPGSSFMSYSPDFDSILASIDF